jgi:hypothetical protein
MSLDDRLLQINQSLRLFHSGGDMMFPVKEVCGGKELVDKYPSSLYLTILVIIHLVLDLPQGQLQGDGSLRRGGILTGTGYMSLAEQRMWGEHWQTQSGYRIHKTQGGWGG